MTSAEQVKNIATKNQTSETNIAVEYCQHSFLASLYRLAEGNNLLFKGGTALKIVFNSPRFSEDLDFTSNTARASQVESLLLNSLAKVASEGINTDVLEAKTTSGGYLTQFLFTWLDFSVQIKCKVSFRQKGSKNKGELFTINPEYLPTYTLMALDTNHLVEEKIKACLGRQKPRDFYDVYFLLRSRLIDPRQKVLLTKIQQKLHSSKINFSAELKKFLPISMHSVIKDFRKTLGQELKRSLA